MTQENSIKKFGICKQCVTAKQFESWPHIMFCRWFCNTVWRNTFHLQINSKVGQNMLLDKCSVQILNYVTKYTIDCHNFVLKTVTNSESLFFTCQKSFRIIKNSICQMWTCRNIKESSHKTIMPSCHYWKAKHTYQLL